MSSYLHGYQDNHESSCCCQIAGKTVEADSTYLRQKDCSCLKSETKSENARQHVWTEAELIFQFWDCLWELGSDEGSQTWNINSVFFPRMLPDLLEYFQHVLFLFHQSTVGHSPISNCNQEEQSKRVIFQGKVRNSIEWFGGEAEVGVVGRKWNISNRS